MSELIVVRHQATAPLGIIEEVVRDSGTAWRYLDVFETAAMPDISEVSGLIVLGGEMSAGDLDRYPYLRDLRALMAEAVANEIPTLGICLGAQVLTLAAGGEVTPAPEREIGFLPVKATDSGMDDPVIAPFAPEAKVFQFHEDQCGLPAGAELLLEGEGARVQAFKLGSAYGIQFHFEVTPQIIGDWCDEVPDLEDGWGKSKQEVLAEAKEHLVTQQAAGRAAAKSFLALLE